MASEYLYDDNFMTNKKRKRSENQNKKNLKKPANSKHKKKNNSARIKKGFIIPPYYFELDNFMSMIDAKYENTIFDEKDRLKGDELVLEYRKNKALEKANEIFKQNIKSIKENDIDNLLEYDNTNKNILYKIIEYYHEKNDKYKLDETIKKYKYCITQRFHIIEDNNVERNIDLKKISNINYPFMELEELPNKDINENNCIDLRNELINIYTSYYYLSEVYVTLKNVLNLEEQKKIFTIFYESDSKNGKCILQFDDDEKKNIIKKHLLSPQSDVVINNLNSVLNLIGNFLGKYLFYKEFETFELNQPVDYNTNLTLYYNYFLYSLYEYAIEVNNNNSTLEFRFNTFLNYYSLRKFHNLIFDGIFDKKVQVNETINELMQLLFLYLSSKYSSSFFCTLTNINAMNKKFLDENSAKVFIDKINTGCKKVLKAYFNSDKNKIIIEDVIENIAVNVEFKYYTCDILSYPKIDLKILLPFLWNDIKFEIFQTRNFFCPEDISYLFYLIEHILSSNLFKDIYSKYNNVQDVTDYYFSEERNIKDFIKRIKFLPFDSIELGKHAITDRRILSVLLSGFPQKKIYNILDYILYRVVELSLRVIILIHEPCHFIKSVYSMITNGKISRETSNKNNSFKDGEAGFLLEYILFGWKNTVEYKFNLDKFNIAKIKHKNKIFEKKQIDLATALVLLDPDTYDKDLNYFRQKLYGVNKEDLKFFNFSNYKGRYKEYLELVFKYENIIQKNWKRDIIVNASKDLLNSINVEYKSTNHNIKFDN